MRTVILAIAGILIALAPASCASGSTLAPLLQENSLPPIGHSLFCQRYPQDCMSKAPAPRFLLESTKNLYSDLELVQRRVNLSISPLAPNSSKSVATDLWQVSPLTGDCNDFAVTKRHQLLQRGWPSWALLLAEVTLKSGEHHLVLVVNLRGESFVLDNLETSPIWLFATDRYRWNRIQSPTNTKLWLVMGTNGKPPPLRSGTRVSVNAP